MEKLPKKILILQLRRIGDVLFTLPIVGVLRREFPEAKIDFLVEPPADELVRLNPYLDETLVYEKKDSWKWIYEIRRRKYDWVLDFLCNGRTLILTLLSGAEIRAALASHWLRNLVYNRTALTTTQKYIVEQKMDLLKALGIHSDSWEWDLKIPESYLSWAEEFLKKQDALLAPLIGFVPATRRATRAWIPERFSELVVKLINDCCSVIFFWGPSERAYVEGIMEKAKSQLKPSQQKRLILPPATSLLQLGALIQKCSLVVGVDNGPRNLAVALNVPTVALFGPTNPLSINPKNDLRHLAIWDKNLFCIHCELNQCPYQHECMESISVERVYQAVKILLQQKGELVRDAK